MRRGRLLLHRRGRLILALRQLILQEGVLLAGNNLGVLLLIFRQTQIFPRTHQNIFEHLFLVFHAELNDALDLVLSVPFF